MTICKLVVPGYLEMPTIRSSLAISPCKGVPSKKHQPNPKHLAMMDPFPTKKSTQALNSLNKPFQHTSRGLFAMAWLQQTLCCKHCTMSRIPLPSVDPGRLMFPIFPRAANSLTHSFKHLELCSESMLTQYIYKS